MLSEFDIGNPKKGTVTTKSHLYSFGGSHAIYKKVYNPENPQPIGTEKNPGPGHYDEKNLCIGTDGAKYGIQGRSINMSGKYTIFKILI